jgi:hypothetical protein
MSDAAVDVARFGGIDAFSFAPVLLLQRLVMME